MTQVIYLLYRLNLLSEYFESPLPPLATGTPSRFAIRRLTVDFSSSMYVLSISLTTNVGQGRYFYSNSSTQNPLHHFPQSKSVTSCWLLHSKFSQNPLHLSFNCFRQQLKTFSFCNKYWHQSQHYFSALETLLMRSTNPWYLLNYLLTYSVASPQQVCNKLAPAKVCYVVSFPKFHYNDS